MKHTQLAWVQSQLAQYGEVTRNQCIRNNITRLSAIILKLKGMGYDFTTSERGGDYVYSTAKVQTGESIGTGAPLRLVYDPIKGVMVRV